MRHRTRGLVTYVSKNDPWRTQHVFKIAFSGVGTWVFSGSVGVLAWLCLCLAPCPASRSSATRLWRRIDHERSQSIANNCEGDGCVCWRRMCTKRRKQVSFKIACQNFRFYTFSKLGTPKHSQLLQQSHNLEPTLNGTQHILNTLLLPKRIFRCGPNLSMFCSTCSKNAQTAKWSSRVEPPDLSDFKTPLLLHVEK